MMLHADFTMLMSLVLDGEATDAEAVQLREHLRGCDMCAQTWQRWQEVDRRFGLAPMLPAPVDMAANVAARLEVRRAEQTRRRWFMSGLALAWSLVMVIAVVALGVANGWRLGLTPEQGPQAAAWSAILSTGGWIWSESLDLVARVGAPAVAATSGILLCVTCALAMVWLWLVARLTAGGQAKLAPTK